ncbi:MULTISPECIES: helix-turn-helix domain-containing protein [Bacillaceae]|uniref:helix-turn-helix domain-containing protein n=1 Tax=Bacillaceae TaxID=186817 RepID=UPI003000544A
MLRITFEREKIGMSKAELSRQAGLDQSLISKIESGRIKPYPSEIKKISQVLGLPAEQLLKDVISEEKHFDEKI